MTKRVEAIQNDDSIPLRANKKKGTKSKKELREEVQQEAAEKLKDISVKHGFVSGKWLMFAPADRVDVIWNSAATSLIEGPLAATSAYLTKVATSPREQQPNYQHVLCLYIPDVYDKDDVTDVMKVLLRRHGVNLSGVKSNLYTAIGLDSKHPSGIQSTVWKNAALMSDTDMKALKDEYFAELNATKAADAENAAASQGMPGDTKPAKLKLKKKTRNDDPFVSDDEAEGVKSPGRAEVSAPASKAKKQPLRKKAKTEPEFEDDDDEIEGVGEQQVKKQAPAKKSPTVKSTAGRKRSKSSSDNDDSEEERPKKSMRKTGKK
ncbi:uncharacterized protein PHACADRAFT_259801 [Phanerochaete carnosa HHB-10118-sp]|uniref:Uncharacterized protein n=1 Tax=Phanerochaete carnosa (strain HHB-10118-sp) TaxID=650164 RepID=K5VPP7_PHACS|nr:uncharacterized protein PHACADRAFT_259801 [Phanerochaete carnosa HHB-10118-sp]EKM53423.1 hypothetical protein PHACADRAFT_259801 [Phanerochaete carnosa HHB-10118-sp]